MQPPPDPHAPPDATSGVAVAYLVHTATMRSVTVTFALAVQLFHFMLRFFLAMHVVALQSSDLRDVKASESHPSTSTSAKNDETGIAVAVPVPDEKETADQMGQILILHQG